MERQTTFCTYRVRPGAEAEFEKLLVVHWMTLHEQGLVTDTPSQVFRGREESGAAYYLELFQWRSEEAAHQAHEVDQVGAVWGPMADLCEERDGRAAMEFAEVDSIPIRTQP